MEFFKNKIMEKLKMGNIGRGVPFDDFSSYALGIRVSKKELPDLCNELEQDGLITIEHFKRKKFVRINGR